LGGRYCRGSIAVRCTPDTVITPIQTALTSIRTPPTIADTPRTIMEGKPRIEWT